MKTLDEAPMAGLCRVCGDPTPDTVFCGEGCAEYAASYLPARRLPAPRPPVDVGEVNAAVQVYEFA